MNQYKIFRNHLGNQEAVKQGWSWPAFFFNWIWAFLKKMNALGSGVLIGSIILGMMAGAAGNGDAGDTMTGITGLAWIAVIVMFGVNGNSWREKNLLSRAYELKGTITAESDEAALAVFAKQEQEKKPPLA